MSFKKWSAAVVLTLVMLLGVVSFASAAVGDGLSVSLECHGFTSLGGSLILDRDNTGTQREAIVISATDGAGNVIFPPTTDTALVGSRLDLGVNVFFGWTAAPKSNPLTLTITSPAGNGLAEQIIYQVGGFCVPLEEQVTPIPQITTFTFLEEPIGYAIVNTDNLNMRSGDGVQYTVVAVLDGGTVLDVLGRNAKGTWWYVQVGRVRGWVNGSLIILRGDLTGVPELEAVGFEQPPTFYVYIDNKIYTSPRKTALAMCIIPGYTEYQIIGRNKSATHYQIIAQCTNGFDVVGWISTEFGAFRNPGGKSVRVTDLS